MGTETPALPPPSPLPPRSTHDRLDARAPLLLCPSRASDSVDVRLFPIAARNHTVRAPETYVSAI
jgi:hypothetical protein